MMASGPLRFRTPLIEELPTAHTKQAPGFAYVAFDPNYDPARAQLKPTSSKRGRNQITGSQTEAQREAFTARQQREIQRRIDALNVDNSKDVNIPIPKKPGEHKAGSQRDGKTTNTKKILASGKTFAHYLDDEEAELARNGGRTGPVEHEIKPDSQRASKTPIARRKVREEKRASADLPPTSSRRESTNRTSEDIEMPDVDDEDSTDDTDGLSALISKAELEALLNAPPLSFNQARVAPPPPNAPPPRTFCEMCGYWGRMKCLKCGNRYCSVRCKDVHDKEKCLKFYA
ncbi:hypothetical protein K431DRAFT_23249 [Polychaeton citri CBS 116435]|uniref:HIT-type domain-containing protein n=1 Tax=Polychaeton citri CBS 116435 TaxID=1314669 RepID=A0A9P4QEM5_9PEZI|nr:hypothetical protein K431DRAFT_23249 [Polychaeton citri CBS 116435]